MSNPDPIADRQRGVEALDRGDFQAAIRYLSPAAANPADIEAQCKLGWAQSQVGQHGAAFAILDSAASRAPGQAEVHFYRGRAFIQAGQPAEADAALREALRLNPHHTLAASWLQWLRQPALPPGQPAVAPPMSGFAPPVYPPAGAAGAPGYPPPAPAPGRGVKGGVIFYSCLSVFVVVSLIFGGIAVLIGSSAQQTRREFPKPVVLTYAQFVKQKPKRGWFRITDAVLCVAEATWVESDSYSSGVSNIHVPVRGPEEEIGRDKIQLLYATTDPKITETVGKLAEYQRKDQADAAIQWGKANPQRVFVVGDIEGTIGLGLMSNGSKYDLAVSAQKSLAPDFRVMESGTTDPGASASLLQAGYFFWGGTGTVAAIALVLWLVLSRRKRPAAPPAV